MGRRAFKKVLAIIFVIILFITLVLAFLFAYWRFCMPDIIKDFIKYDGICFDYTLEENDYINKLHYKQLSEDEARHYRCMYHAAINNETFYYLESSDLFNAEEATRAVRAFDFDFPEYYWFGQILASNYAGMKDKLNVFEWGCTIVNAECYEFEDDDLLTNKELIESKIESIIPLLVSDNDYDTIKHVFDYIVNNTEYDLDYSDKSDIRAVLLDGRAVCSSYSETFQLLCNRLGYECYSVQGDSKDLLAFLGEDDNQIFTDSSHEWNIIKINDNWYWVDPTWGEIEYNDLNGDPANGIDYSYFLVPDYIFFLDHIYDEMFVYPECMDDLYFLYDDSGVVLNDFNDDVVSKYLIKAFKQGRTDFTYHFDDEYDINNAIDWASSKKFFDIYRNNIYQYYNGIMNYYISNNYSMHLFWDIDNFY